MFRDSRCKLSSLDNKMEIQERAVETSMGCIPWFKFYPESHGETMQILRKKITSRLEIVNKTWLW